MAYRSVPRPSSPLNAKASTRRPFALDHPIIAIPYRTCGEVHACGWSLMEKLPVFNPLKAALRLRRAGYVFVFTMSKFPTRRDAYLDRIGVGPAGLFGKAMVFTFFTTLSQWFFKGF